MDIVTTVVSLIIVIISLALVIMVYKIDRKIAPPLYLNLYIHHQYLANHSIRYSCDQYYRFGYQHHRFTQRFTKGLIAMNLKEIRAKQGLSVPKLVELSGVPRRTIQNIEKNGDCKVSTAILLANALNVTLDELCVSKTLP